METRPNIKVRVKKEFVQLKEILPLGFETELIQVYSKEDKTYPGFWTKINNKRVWVEDKIVPKGTFIGLNFMGANGEIYNTDTISNFIGPYPLGDIFHKY